MADETRIIQINTGTTAQWNNQVRALKVGEFGFDKDTKEVKIGDGASSFANLEPLLTKSKLPAATNTDLGAVKLATATVQTVAPQSPTAVAGRTYGVQQNGSGQLTVNVPWTDTNTTYSVATTSADGLMSAADKTKLDSGDIGGGDDDWPPKAVRDADTIELNVVLNDSTLSGVFFIEDKFHAYASECEYTSPDGVLWTKKAYPDNALLKQLLSTMIYMVYDEVAGMYVGSGDEYTTLIQNHFVTTTDGITWTIRAGSSTGEGSIFAGGGNFIQYSYIDATYYVSYDAGASWQAFSNVPGTIIGCGDGKFIAVSAAGGIVKYSTDGQHWYSVNVLALSDGVVFKAQYIHGKWILFVTDYTTYSGYRIWVSSDLSTWTNIVSPFELENAYAAWNGAEYTVFYYRDQAVTSPDGVVWTECSLHKGFSIDYAAYNDDRCVMLGVQNNSMKLFATNVDEIAAASLPQFLSNSALITNTSTWYAPKNGTIRATLIGGGGGAGGTGNASYGGGYGNAGGTTSLIGGGISVSAMGGCGGGGGGATSAIGGGGGAGETLTIVAPVTKNTAYTAIIGAGGSSSSTMSTNTTGVAGKVSSKQSVSLPAAAGGATGAVGTPGQGFPSGFGIVGGNYGATYGAGGLGGGSYKTGKQGAIFIEYIN